MTDTPQDSVPSPDLPTINAAPEDAKRLLAGPGAPLLACLKAATPTMDAYFRDLVSKVSQYNLNLAARMLEFQTQECGVRFSDPKSADRAVILLARFMDSASTSRRESPGWDAVVASAIQIPILN